MRTALNIIWVVLAGIWLALGYVIAAVLMATSPPEGAIAIGTEADE
jgi:uncharacterized membrane protein YccF (DUF307 family)